MRQAAAGPTTRHPRWAWPTTPTPSRTWSPALDLRRVHLCGLSFGGGLALAVYRRHPGVVRSLVLASAYAGWRGSLPPEEVEARLTRARGELNLTPATWIDSYLP